MDISAATVVLKLLVLVDIMATLFSLHQQHEGDSNNNKNNQRNGNAAGSIQPSIFGSLLGQVLVRCPRISRRTPSIPTGNNSRSDNDEENDSTPITAITAEDLHSSPFNAYYLFSALEGCRQNSQAIINRANNLVQLHQLQHEEEEEEEEEEENGKVGSGHKSKKPRNRIDDEKRLTASDVDNLRSLMTLNRTALADLKQSLSSFIHADREVIATGACPSLLLLPNAYCYNNNNNNSECTNTFSASCSFYSYTSHFSSPSPFFTMPTIPLSL